MGQSQAEPLALNAQSTGRDLNQWGSTTVSSQPTQAWLCFVYLPLFFKPSFFPVDMLTPAMRGCA